MAGTGDHAAQYAAFLALLVECRRRAGVTQAQLGERLSLGQPGVSKIERGERRVDVIELRAICAELGIGLAEFAATLEARLAGRGRA